MASGKRGTIVKSPTAAASTATASKPRPPKAELDAMYADLVEELGLPAMNEEALQNEDDEKKWKLIQLHMSTMTAGGDATKKNAQFYVDMLSETDPTGVPTLTVEKAGEFCRAIRRAHKQFFTDFLKIGGVESLLRLTHWYLSRSPLVPTERERLDLLLESFKSLMDNRVGMSGMLAIEGSINTLALGMQIYGNQQHEPNLVAAKHIVTLLAMTCFHSSKGRALVVEAMDQVRRKWRESKRYESLIRMFHRAKRDTEFRAAVITFVTTMVNSGATIEQRVSIRNDFLALDVVNVFRQGVAEARDDDEHCETIATQFQVFEDMMVADHSELIADLLDRTKEQFETALSNDDDNGMVHLQDQDNVFLALKQATAQGGVPAEFLSVLQTMLLIPTERVMSAPVWKAIAVYITDTVQAAVLGPDKRKTVAAPGTGKGSMDAMKNVLSARVALDKKLVDLASVDQVVARQRAKIEELTKELEKPKVDEKRKKLEEEIALLREQNAMQYKEIDRLNAAVAAEKKRADEAEAKAARAASAAPLASSAAAPAAPAPVAAVAAVAAPVAAVAAAAAAAPSGDGCKMVWGPPCKNKLVPDESYCKDHLIYKKFCMMKRNNIPDGAIMQRMAMDSAAPGAPKIPVPPELSGLDAAAPAAGGAAPGAAAAAAVVRPKGPVKPKVEPKTKMRRLEWRKIDVDSFPLEATIWSEIKDQNAKMDIPNLVAHFQDLTALKKAAETGDKAAAAKKEVSIVDGNRQQNVGMGMKALKRKGFPNASGQEIVQVLFSLDETRLSLDVAKMLQEMSPKPEEVKELRGYDGDLANLTDVDRFLYELTNVPRIETRLKSIAARFTFENDAQVVKSKLVSVREACIEISKSKYLRQILELILAVGNYMNGGTPRGQAWGFKIELLEKLEHCKDATNKSNLADYVTHVLEANYPGLLDAFILPKCEACQGISLTETRVEMEDLKKKVALIKSELSALGESGSSKSDRFSAVFTPFQLKASKQVQELDVDMEIVKEDFLKLAKRFQESELGLEPNTFFGSFVRLQNSLRKSYEAIKVARVKEAKAKLAEEEKKRLMAAHRDRPEVGIGEAFKQANQGDAKTIFEKFKQHREAGVEASG